MSCATQFMYAFGPCMYFTSICISPCRHIELVYTPELSKWLYLSAATIICSQGDYKLLCVGNNDCGTRNLRRPWTPLRILILIKTIHIVLFRSNLMTWQLTERMQGAIAMLCLIPVSITATLFMYGIECVERSYSITKHTKSKIQCATKQSHS